MLSKQEEQLERRETLDNDRLVREQGGSTFLAHTHNDVGGRFAAISSPTVVGEKQIPNYPAAFLQHDPVPDEPKLGIDVNAMEPCGEPHELKASVAEPLGPSFPSAKATSSAVPLAEHGDPTAVPPPGRSRVVASFRRF